MRCRAAGPAPLAVPVVVGAVTAAALAQALVSGPVTAEIRGHTMGYAIGLPHTPLIVAGYLLATVGALLLSGDRRLCVLGLLMGVGALVCSALWRLEFVSTWCALAALCSVVLLGWVRARSRGAVEVSPTPSIFPERPALRACRGPG